MDTDTAVERFFRLAAAADAEDPCETTGAAMTGEVRTGVMRTGDIATGEMMVAAGRVAMAAGAEAEAEAAAAAAAPAPAPAAVVVLEKLNGLLFFLLPNSEDQNPFFSLPSEACALPSPLVAVAVARFLLPAAEAAPEAPPFPPALAALAACLFLRPAAEAALEA